MFYLFQIASDESNLVIITGPNMVIVIRMQKH